MGFQLGCPVWRIVVGGKTTQTWKTVKEMPIPLSRRTRVTFNTKRIVWMLKKIRNRPKKFAWTDRVDGNGWNTIHINTRNSLISQTEAHPVGRKSSRNSFTPTYKKPLKKGLSTHKSTKARKLIESEVETLSLLRIRLNCLESSCKFYQKHVLSFK